SPPTTPPRKPLQSLPKTQLLLLIPTPLPMWTRPRIRIQSPHRSINPAQRRGRLDREITPQEECCVGVPGESALGVGTVRETMGAETGEGVGHVCCGVGGLHGYS